MTLEPGVTIQFEQDNGLIAADGGGLDARGTEDAPIVLTGVEQQSGFWRGVRVDTASWDNAFDYVTVEYAGSGTFPGGQTSPAGLYVDRDGTISVSNSTFRNNDGAGLLVDFKDSDTTIDSSLFENNELPVYLHANQVDGLGADNTYRDNDKSYIGVGVQDGRDLLEDDADWVAPPIPYRIARRIKVTDAHLTLTPGTTLAFDEGLGLIVKNSRLTADASGGDRIRFTAAQGEEINGYWHGIRFNKSKSEDNVLRNVTVEYGGSDNWKTIGDTQSNINLDESQIALENAEIDGSGGPGLAVGEDSTVDRCTDVTFRDNSGRNVAGNGTANCSSD